MTSSAFDQTRLSLIQAETECITHLNELLFQIHPHDPMSTELWNWWMHSGKSTMTRWMRLLVTLPGIPGAGWKRRSGTERSP